MENTTSFRDAVADANRDTEAVCEFCGALLVGRAIDREVWEKHTREILDAIGRREKAKAQELRELREQYHVIGLICPDCGFAYCPRKHDKELGISFWRLREPRCPRCGKALLINTTRVVIPVSKPETRKEPVSKPETRKEPVPKPARKPLTERIGEHYDELHTRGRVTILGVILMLVLGFLGYGVGAVFYMLVDAIINGLGDLFIYVLEDNVLLLALMAILPIILYLLAGAGIFFSICYGVLIGNWLGKNRNAIAFYTVLALLIGLVGLALISAYLQDAMLGMELVGRYAEQRAVLRWVLLLIGYFGTPIAVIIAAIVIFCKDILKKGSTDEKRTQPAPNLPAGLPGPIFGPPNVEKLEKKGDVKGLIKALGYKKDINVRLAAVEALGQIGDPGAVEPLLAALKDDEWRVRKNAADALGEIGDPCAVEPLLAALKDDKLEFVRSRAASALGKIGDVRAVEPLLAALKDDESHVVRSSAALAQGTFGDARAVEPLLAALKDDESDLVRSMAAVALGALGYEQALEPLRTASKNDESERVRDVASQALEKLQN